MVNSSMDREGDPFFGEQGFSIPVHDSSRRMSGAGLIGSQKASGEGGVPGGSCEGEGSWANTPEIQMFQVTGAGPKLSGPFPGTGRANSFTDGRSGEPSWDSP